MYVFMADANISYTGVESGPIVARLHMDRCCVQVPPDQHPNCQVRIHVISHDTRVKTHLLRILICECKNLL